jgi:chromosome segregation ATPase
MRTLSFVKRRFRCIVGLFRLLTVCACRRSELGVLQESVRQKEADKQELEMRARELEAACAQHVQHTKGLQSKISELEQACREAGEREAESSQRCKEAEKVARDATRSASKELYLVQAQASHLRQQVHGL